MSSAKTIGMKKAARFIAPPSAQLAIPISNHAAQRDHADQIEEVERLIRRAAALHLRHFVFKLRDALIFVLHDLIQPLNRRQRDAVGIDGGDVLVVFAHGESRGEILRHGADVANGGVLRFVVPRADGNLRQFLHDRRAHRSGAKLALLLRSLNADQALLPVGTCTPAVDAPEPLMAVTKYTPPVARAVKALLSPQAKSKLFESAHVKQPLLSDLAR